MALHPLTRRRSLAVIMMIAAVASARGLGSIYPLSTYEMYAEPTIANPSRLAIRDDEGAVHEVELFVDWRCAAPIDGLARRCLEDGDVGLDYLDDAAEAHILAHPGDGDADLTLIRRRWRFPSDDAAPTIDECVIARCRARRGRDAASPIAVDMLPAEDR